MNKSPKSPRAKPAVPKVAAAQRKGGLTPANEKPDAVVALGASAGGLEALENFLRNVPVDTRACFVVIQHMDPTRKGLIVELLQRVTALPVRQLVDHMPLAAGCVFVKPSDKDATLLRGRFHLSPPVEAHGFRLPIDVFFSSLAEHEGARAVGVVLSGMGSDGTLGLRAIKDKGGLCLAQSPESAGSDAMPRSAIDSGVVDAIARSEDLPSRIVALQGLPREEAPEASACDLSEEARNAGLESVIGLLRRHTGQDFSRYKRSTLQRRIERRMGLHHIVALSDYADYVRKNPQESELLFKELLIGVTSFFRDEKVWDLLRTEVIPSLFAARPEGGVLRAWVPGCSSGEEAYSLAICFREALNLHRPSAHFSLQIFASDIDKDAIAKARTGMYTAASLVGLSPARVHRFFVEEDGAFRVSKDIREMVIFAVQNVTMDPPFTKLDLLSCRNLLIYLQADLQKKLLPVFHYSLKPGGILMLGSAETVGPHLALFSPINAKARIYSRQSIAMRVDFPSFPSRMQVEAMPSKPSKAGVPPSFPNLQELTTALLLKGHVPVAVLTNSQGDILYISGKTGRYLEPAAGKANLNLFAMARQGLDSVLDVTFKNAVLQRHEIRVDGVQVGDQSSRVYVDLVVQPLPDEPDLSGLVLVVFHEAPAPEEGTRSAVEAKVRGAGRTETKERDAGLRRELESRREELLLLRHEMQASQEELRSANEELQSTNEELQSTNEELTTSKEEMQSMNEELQTVNQELQAKLDELSRTSDDMKNLLNSTDIATLFLDENLHVRRFTTQTTNLFKLIPGDAGRPITDIVSELDYPGLAADAREVLASLVSRETDVVARNGRWFRVRIMPYRAQGNRIDGLVITFVEISLLKEMESLLKESFEVLDDVQGGEETGSRKRMGLAQFADKVQAVLKRNSHPRGKS